MSSKIHTIEIESGDSIVIMIDGKPVALTVHRGSKQYVNGMEELVEIHDLLAKTFIAKDEYNSTGCFSAGGSLTVSEITIEGITAALNS